MKCCDVCGIEIKDKPFFCMNAAGESTIAQIFIYNNQLVLCPSCTLQLYLFLKKEVIEHKNNRINVIKQQKIVDLKEYKKLLGN